MHILESWKGRDSMIYTVQPGDNLYQLAGRFQTTVERIAATNGLSDPSALIVGEDLVIDQPTEVHRVREGETLREIAVQYGVSVSQLWRNNPELGGKSDIVPGQVLTVSLPNASLGTIEVNGYAYPFINRDTLRKTLPYLTYLSMFSYGIKEDGTLLAIDDDEIIAIALEYDVAPIMVLTSITERGTFSSDLVAQLLRDDALQAEIIESIVDVMEQKPYVGVDVDFEYVPAEYADRYVTFIEALRGRLAPLGKQVNVALAPKTSDDQQGLLYEGHPYGALGHAADAVTLMAYEWGYTYGPPQAVAPLNRVREVVEYAVSVIPPQKILLGSPNYGYNWTLPFVQGTSKAQSLSNVTARSLALERNVAISFDEVAQAPYFRYYVQESGIPVEHIVWFENARSVEATLRLIDEFGLRGISIWQIMNYFPQLWAVLNSMVTIRKII